MPRYLVERSFPAGLNIPMDGDGAKACLGVVDNNAGRGVTWIHSYVSTDKRKTYCIYDAPDAEAICQTASTNMLPVDAVSEIRVLDPYFYY